MNEAYSFPYLIALEGMDAATVLKAYPEAANGLFYTQTCGNKNHLKLSLCKSTGTPQQPLPAVTFTSSKYALDLNLQATGSYTMLPVSRLADKAFN